VTHACRRAGPSQESGEQTNSENEGPQRDAMEVMRHGPHQIVFALGAAHKNNLSVVEACKSWYSAAFLLETVPNVIYILMKHGRNLEESIVRAVYDTLDNDTIAAIVGAAVGDLHGKKRIPKRWISRLSGRTSYSDDGRGFDLLREAGKLWG
jgi:ADP-ribosyl-[dinitrogen reductase] hydrolase